MLELSNTVIKEGVLSDHIYNSNYKKDYTANQLTLISPANTKVVIPKNVAMQIDTGDISLGGSLLINPKNENELILTTLETTTDSAKQNICIQKGDCLVKNKIYTYNLDTKVLDLLYQVPNQKVRIPYEYQILGMEGTNLVLVKHYIGTGSVCDNSWLQEADSYSYLDMTDVKAGLKSYIVPAQRIKKAQTDFNMCLKNI